MEVVAIDKTVQGVYDKAIRLIDAQNENTGSTDTSDTKEYKLRTLSILNTSSTTHIHRAAITPWQTESARSSTT